jgi:hypothetical protein
MLAQEDVAPYLLRHQLLRPEHLVGGQLDIVDVSRRNRNFKVVSEFGPSYLIKQGIGAEKVYRIRHEAEIYQFYATLENGAAFTKYLVRFCEYDSENCILVLELVPGSRSLLEHHTILGRFSRDLARMLGDALGTFHRRFHRALGSHNTSEEGRRRFPSQVPFGLSLHRPDLMIFGHASQASIELVKIVQRFVPFCALLDELESAWSPETLIHGDIRWDNCSVLSGSSSGFRIKLVDWELATFGDPAWDVGTVFGEYLALWLCSAPVGCDMPPEEFLQHARFPLEMMHPYIRSFWYAYRRALNLDIAQSDAFLIKAIKYAAARLLQTAFERVQPATQVTGEAILMLQLSMNVLECPREATVQLLGMQLP